MSALWEKKMYDKWLRKLLKKAIEERVIGGLL